MERKENQKNIEKAIVGAIAFFDMFGYPLTDFEIWKFIAVECGLSDAREVLSKVTETKSPIGDLVSCKNGFYFLKGRSEIIETRLKRYVYADRKFKRAMRVAKVFKLIPWVKMIAVSNVIGAHNLRDGSDIDLFIITEKERIWLTRFFCAAIAQALGLRPKKGDTRDKICLNFYVSEEAMNISELMLKENREGAKPLRFAEANRSGLAPFQRDIYFVYWLANLVPIYEIDDAYKKFIHANGWIKSCLPNWRPVKTGGNRHVRGKESKFNLLNLLNNFENKFKKLQLNLMPAGLKELTGKDTRVVVNDKVLKLHVNDRRGEYRNKFFNKMDNLKLRR